MKITFTLFIFTLFLNLSIAQSYDTLNFEVAPIKIGIDSIVGCWQVGKPSKIIFDSSFSPSNAIVTDTLSPYPDGSYSKFDVSFPVLGTGSAVYSIAFVHRYDTENLKDGGYVEIYDCITGQWQNILEGSVGWPCAGGHEANFNGILPTSQLYNGKIGFTGNSGGWQTNEIYFNCNMVRAGGPDSIKLRFVFISDTISTGQEGWMIDNISLFDSGGMCGGVDENNKRFLIKTYPNPVNENINIESLTRDAIKKIDIINAQGQLVFSSSTQHSKKINLSVEFLKAGVYMIRINNSNYSGYFIKE